MEGARSPDERSHRTASGRTAGAAADVPAPGTGRLLCELFVEALPVSGASITVVGRTGQHCVVGVSDELAARAEAAQFDLGIGPHWDALRLRRPAFFPAATTTDSWPPLTIAVGVLGIESLTAIPLRLGADVIGVVDLCSSSPRSPWSPETIGLGARLATGVAAIAARLATRSARADTVSTEGGAAELRREVHQATGILMAQLRTDAATALLRLRSRAFATGTSLDATAREVVEEHSRIART